MTLTVYIFKYLGPVTYEYVAFFAGLPIPKATQASERCDYYGKRRNGCSLSGLL